MYIIFVRRFDNERFEANRNKKLVLRSVGIVIGRFLDRYRNKLLNALHVMLKIKI